MRPVRILTGATLIALLSGLPAAQSVRDEEKVDYYRKWLDQDVVYLITEEERDVFLKLQTEEERERFIEQFWRRRDLTPETAYNEFKEEHYRRIQYANEHFTSGQPGWKTDRGRIYIRFGPPDRRDTNPTGGFYERPSWEGGGMTQTVPFERWEYRHIEGVGDDIEIEFVDPTETGEYRITTNPNDKDALLLLEGYGLTEAEELGYSQRVDRILNRTNPMPGNEVLLAGFGRLKDQPFEKLLLMNNLERPPKQRFRDLFRPEVLTSVRYGRLPFKLGVDYFAMDEQSYLLPLTVAVPNRELDYVRTRAGTLRSVLDIHGRITSMLGEEVEVFDETIGHDVAESELARTRRDESLYQKVLRLPPGRYKLDLLLMDQNSEKLGSQSKGIILPPPAGDTLMISSLVLADRIDTASPGAFGPARVFPNLDHLYSSDERLLVFYQLSNFSTDAATGAPSLSSRVELKRDGGIVGSDEFTIDEQTARNRPRLHVVHEFDLAELEPGRYTLVLSVEDRIAGDSLTRSVFFEVAAASR